MIKILLTEDQEIMMIKVKGMVPYRSLKELMKYRR